MNHPRNATAPLTVLLALACAAVGLGYSGWRTELSAQGYYYYGPTCVDGTLTVTSLAGSDLDIGWTGIAHDSVALGAASVTTNLDCDASLSSCTIDGSALVGATVGAPLPLSSGGVSSCVVNEFREALLGTYDCETGCASSTVQLLSSVYLVIDQKKPCPPCVGDPTPNDGVKGGMCDGGTTPGAACDVGGISDLFQNAGGAPLDAGRTSSDCLPTGSPVGELDIDLAPLTTGTVSLDADVDCLSGAFPPGSCHCPGQVQPNTCIPDGVCPASGVCENNPPDGVCSNQIYRSCILTDPPASGCEDIAPGSGTCLSRPRPCFGDSISRTGVCGTDEGTLVSIFCISATNAPAINTVTGLPGPGALALPVRRSVFGVPVPTPIVTPTGSEGGTPATPFTTPSPTGVTPTATPGQTFPGTATTPFATPTATGLTPTQTPGVPTATGPAPSPGSPCGNGVLNAGEACDDGNVAAGDCCSPGCQLEADDSACDDGLDCTVADVCAAGFCTGDPLPVCEEISLIVPAGGSATTDTEGDGATAADPLETIVTSPVAGELTLVEMPFTGASPPRGFVFLEVRVEITAPTASALQPLVITFLLDPDIVPAGDDENTIQIFKDGVLVGPGFCSNRTVASPDPCIAGRRRIGGDIAIIVNTTTASEWSFAVPGCATAPLDGCRELADRRKTLLLLGDRAGGGQDELAWRWKKGERTLPEEFGDPLATDSYSLCVYDQSGGDSTHVFQARAHAGGSCGGNQCWRTKPKGGLVYRNRSAQPDGLTRLRLKPSDTSKTEITVRGDGPNLLLPALPLLLPVTVQLQATNGKCWEAVYSASGVGRNDADRFRATGGP